MELRGRLPALVTTGVVLGALVLINLAEHVWHVGMWMAPVAVVTLLLFARWTGLTWAQLGFSGSHARSGLRWGLGAVGVVAVVYAIGLALPATRTAFLDSRTHVSVAGALMLALVVIPISTVLLEEVAFRSVLWGTLSRHVGTVRTLLISSALFGLWHLLPAFHLQAMNRGVGHAVGGAHGTATWLVVLGTVALTGIGGLVAGELRRRSGSLLASVGMHWATNGLGILFGVFAWRFSH
jgi:membrane protease YdiL (CAAX protease family)